MTAHRRAAAPLALTPPSLAYTKAGAVVFAGGPEPPELSSETRLR